MRLPPRSRAISNRSIRNAAPIWRPTMHRRRRHQRSHLISSCPVANSSSLSTSCSTFPTDRYRRDPPGSEILSTGYCRCVSSTRKPRKCEFDGFAITRAFWLLLRSAPKLNEFDSTLSAGTMIPAKSFLEVAWFLRTLPTATLVVGFPCRLPKFLFKAHHYCPVAQARWLGDATLRQTSIDSPRLLAEQRSPVAVVQIDRLRRCTIRIGV